MKQTIPHIWLTYSTLLISSFLFVFLFSCTTSPLYEHYPFWFHDDSGIFQEMGVCLVQGGTPYVDLFDHKGPILWFIQALGIWISPRWGLMTLQTVFLFVTMMLWYKSALIIIEKQFLAIISTFFGLLFLLPFYERGNLCEEWSLLFISLPIYIYILRWKTTSNNKLIFNNSDLLIIGLCVGSLAMIRLNNSGPVVGFLLIHFIKCIKDKDYGRLFTDVALFCGGMIIVFVICSIFYLVKVGWDGVYEMIYGTFIFNFLYMNGTGIRYDTKTKLLFYVLPVGFLLLNILFLFKNKQLIRISSATIISIFISIIAIGRFCYGHYLIIFVPLYVLSIVLILYSLPKFKITYLILLCIVIECLRISYGPLDLLVYRMVKTPPHMERHLGFHNFISSLPKEEQRSIYNAGLNHIGHGMFADENIYQCNRILNSEHLRISSRLQEYQNTHGIKELQPAWVLTQGPKPEANDEYMQSHYALADSIPGGEFDPIWCWKKL